MSSVEDSAELRVRELAYLLWLEAGGPHGRSDYFWRRAQSRIATEEASYDEALDESFPASDPPAHTPIA
jgi:hypothetical protein